MSKREILLNAINITKEKDKTLSGYYLGNHEIPSVMNATGKQTVHDFESKEGESFSIYGFASLNMKMNQVKQGEMVEITYIGTVKRDTKFKKQQDVHEVKIVIIEGDEAGTPDDQPPF